MNTTEKINYFDFVPTSDQSYALNYIKSFVKAQDIQSFILSGAAGTGKTSMIIAIKRFFDEQDINYKLLAPTNRAARVIASKTNSYSSTIHQMIYDAKEVIDEVGNIIQIEFVLKSNPYKNNTVFIVDEASMLSDVIPSPNEAFIVDEASMLSDVIPSPNEAFYSKNSLLSDLITFVFNGFNNNKIIFIGDSYQLPPVKSDYSPALLQHHIESEYNLKVRSFELKEVKRQNSDSYILENAIKIRNSILNRSVCKDIKTEMETNYESWLTNYKKFYQENPSNSIVLGWKNQVIKKVNIDVRNVLFNNPMNLILQGEQLISIGNYIGEVNFPNNTLIEIMEVLGGEETLAGFRFVNVTLKIKDMDVELKNPVKLRIDDLFLDSYDIKREKELLSYCKANNKQYRDTNLKTIDPYLSAIKAKYAYAVTVHKAQGGEWENVFLYPEYPYGNQMQNWLYTAVTRATKRIYTFSYLKKSN